MREVKVRRRSDTGEQSVVRMKAGRNGIVEATYRMDVTEFRVFFTMLTMISPDDVTFCEYEIRVADIMRLFDLSRDGRSYEIIKEAAERLVNKTLVLYHTREDGRRYRTVIPFLTSTTTQIDDVRGESIRVTFHPELKPFLLQLRSEYLEFDVKNLARVQSQYSIRLYMMLRHMMNLKRFTVRYTLERLREIFEIGEKEYPLYGNFKQKVLLRACNDLNETTNIHIDQVEEERSNRKVVAIVFHVSEQKRPLPSARKSAKAEGDAEAEPTLTVVQRKVPVVAVSNDSSLEPVIDELFPLIQKYVSRQVLQDWLVLYPKEQVRIAIRHTLKQLSQGVAIKNVGGYLHKMMATSLPLSFEKPEPKPAEQTKQKELEKARKAEQQQEEKRLEEQTHQQFKQALQTLINHPEWAPQVEAHLRKGLFGHFYKKELTLAENLKNPALVGPFFQIMQTLMPAIFSSSERPE
ncbi:RepB family plasmid replication initiator protein [Larkinella insperata]|uniref:RepB family plasmid replication initiator protein n=1 Tax=Larkinella insperata TaxID=332158 RepID=A0ABW3QKW2_9BACT